MNKENNLPTEDSGAEDFTLRSLYSISEWRSIYTLFKLLFQCKDPVIRRHLLNLKLRNLLMKFQILRLQLGDILLDRRISRLEKQLNIGKFSHKRM